MVLPQPRVRGEVVLHAGSSASGRAFASSGSGVEPVVSTPMPMTLSRENPASLSAAVSAPLTDAEPVEVVRRVLPREVRILVQQDAVVAARVVEDARADDAPVGASTTTARTELVP